jgi:transcriptional regulator with XRE-family HTH domain
MLPKLNSLKLARLGKGLSQWQVSRETGISQSTISLYEQEYREPKPAHKEALAKLYGKEVEELWGETSNESY